MRLRSIAAVAAVVWGGLAGSPGVWAEDLKLSTLDLSSITQDWGQPQADKSVGEHPMSIGGVAMSHGIGTHAVSHWTLELDGKADWLTAKVGMDDEEKDNDGARRVSLEFRVYGDGKLLWKSGQTKIGDAPKDVKVALAGVKILQLVVPEGPQGINYAHADWGEATISYSGAKPRVRVVPPEPKEILTPPPPATPRINGAKVFGVRPGKPVMFKVPATGDRPMTFGAEGLPPGCTIDPQTGVITGKVDAPGEYKVKTTAKNDKGSAERELKIVVGDKISLTPPMGFNSWNCFAGDVTDAKMRAAADAMVSSGLIDHGWTYINVDDCWQVRTNQPMDRRRDASGKILTNDKFPDMKAMADYIHSKGLKAGLYSSPGPATCAGFAGSYKFEEIDAKTWADWGYDYIKYDWCSYGGVADQFRKQPDRPSEHDVQVHPYKVMAAALAKTDRDIVFSLCQYGMDNVWEWGGSIGAQCWRTTGDIVDTWNSMAGIGFGQSDHARFVQPGNWNDPDMLVVGLVGWGPKLHPTRLTPNEQYTHITLWSMIASPLLIGCDMTKMDDFTKNLLTNDEVIAVNQDPLAKAGSRVTRTETGTEVWSRDLEDGTKAVALFNRGELEQTVSITWKDLGLEGPQPVRDLWRQKDLGDKPDGFEAQVNRHGTVFVKVGKPK